MKQTKWQRLATIGLCSSLVINAFSGVTAVAETITIESSPTVASSAKEATSASSATPASTESSQETTETSREEGTQETEKPEEITKTSDSKIDMIDPLNNSLQNSPTVSPKATVAIPSQVMDFAIVDEENNGVALTTPITGDSQWVRTGGVNGLVGSVQSVRYSTAYAGKNVFFNRITIPGVNYSNTVNFAYGLRNVTITLPKWYKGLSFVKPSYSIYPASYISRYDNNGQTQVGWWKMSSDSALGQSMHVIAQPNVYQVKHGLDEVGLATASFSFNAVYRVGSIANKTYTKYNIGPDALTNNYNIIYMYTTKRKVTENFVDVNGIKITPPSGFTQGKQTVINSDPYTFKQSGTLPEIYKASNGKTYQFKGWYKGKTKPNTLTTTKAPSYAVTYNDNDDLNVVYEEIEAFDFPALTYQFGFVGEDGKLANPADINITYDYKTSAYRGTGGGADDTVSFGTIATNQSATTVGNLKNVTMPATSIARPTETGYNGDAYANFSIKLPRYYQSLNLYDKTGKINPSYPLPAYTRKYSVRYDDQILSEASVIAFLRLTQKSDQSYAPYESYSVVDPSVKYPEFLHRVIYSTDLVSGYAKYTTFSSPVYYHLTNRKITENFVDANGTKITPPTGFTQGKQTVINSDPYTFKQSGTLPDTYTTGGKTYKFKGWYKGKTKPNTLTTTKAPSYPVTYDDNDDLNVVYEEIEAFDFPAVNYQFGFVGEDGKLANPADINITYDYTGIEVRGNGGADSNVSFKTIASNQSGTTVGNFKQVIFPASSIERPTTTGWNGDGFSEFSIKLPKYYESVNLYDKTGKINTNYPLPRVTLVESNVPDTIFSESTLISDLALTQKADKSYTLREVNVSMNPNIKYPNLISRNINSLDERDGNIRYKTIEGPIYYHLTNRKVTENFVNTSGTKITPPTGFTQGNQIPMTSNTFKYTAAKALPASYTTGGKTYIFQGWYKGKTKPNTLTTSTTPTYSTTFDGNDDMTAMYKEEVPKASVALTRTTAETVTSGGNVTWRATITNTSQAPLTTATIKKSTAWTTGLAAPTAMIVTPAGGTAKTVPVTATTWTNGVSLGTDIPVGKSATVQFTTKATGTAGQVLRAGITTSGNYSGVSASATVRVKDNDQAIVTPTAEGFISVPMFNFGQVGVAGSTQQHSLKKAADYYGNGTRNPYLRIKKTQPNWSLTAQLSQPKSVIDSLPTATRLLLGAAPVSSFSNYNQPTELKNAVGTTSAISLNANNTATRIIANQQFTGSNIYQLDFTFNNVKLEVPANQGVKGQQYQAAVTWNLVTGP
ncbi:WxL domain-containing protein [Enterococcus sp. DIV1420a]|uniref:WxL domain-containing protein n=1 Tax=Enterococcus sp. DIV1420a TaxID=2774672 RepID=UPI003F23152C